MAIVSIPVPLMIWNRVINLGGKAIIMRMSAADSRCVANHIELRYISIVFDRGNNDFWMANLVSISLRNGKSGFHSSRQGNFARKKAACSSVKRESRPPEITAHDI